MNKKLLFALLLSLGFAMESMAVTYYSKTSGGNWNDAASWSTTGYGQSTNTGTYPKSGDYAYIGDGYTIVVNTTSTTSYLFVGQGSSGIVEFFDGGNYTLTVINNLTISSGATLRYTGNNSRTHVLQVGNNISNSGTLDLYSDANDVVNLVFYRTANSVVSGNGTYDLNTVTIQKSTAITYYVEVQSTAFEAAIRDLVLTFGTYYHNNSSTYLVNSGAGSGFTIPSDGAVKINQGTLHLSPSQDDMVLNGTITVLGGTLLIGSTDGNTGLRYEKIGGFTPRLDIQGGNMEVYGGITYKTGASSSPINFTISGGILTLNSGATGTATTVFRVNDVTGSNATFSDGTVVICKPNTTGSSITDVEFCGDNGTVTTTGATLQFGNASSGSGLTYIFTPENAVTFPNLYLTGPSGNTATLCPVANSTANIKANSINIDYDKTFDIRSISGTTGDARTLTLTGNYDGINSLYCDGSFNARSSEVLLQGGEGQQISGSGSLTFYKLTMNNSNGSTLGQSITIDDVLTLTDGVIYSTATYPLTISATGSVDMGSATSYIDGPLIRSVATASPTTLDFPIGKDGAYRPVQIDVTHSDGSSVDYTAEIMNSSPRTLSYTLPGSIDRISGVRYLSVSRSGAANLSSSSVTMYYDADDGVSDPSNLRLVQDNGSSSWIDIGGTGSGSGSGSITSASLAAINNVFTFGNANGGSNPLPVSWLYFNVWQKYNDVKLEWATAVERNADYFEVQRSTAGTEFVSIGRVQAAGNSNTLKKYSYADGNKIQGTVYYRIKQVDTDGSFTLSAIKSVNTSSEQTMIFPNPPAPEGYTLSLSDKFIGELTVRTLDVTGRILSEKQITADQKLIFLPSSAAASAQNSILQVVDANGNSWSGQIMANSGDE